MRTKLKLSWQKSICKLISLWGVSLHEKKQKIPQVKTSSEKIMSVVTATVLQLFLA